MSEESTPIKRMDIDEFLRLGFLQEANRQFFHPLGLALEVETDDEGNAVSFGGVWDYRDDPEGMLFADLSDDESRQKFLNVANEKDRHRNARCRLIGGIMQPLGDKRP